MGIAQQFRGGYQLGSVWYDAVRDGLTVAGHRAVAEALAPTDVEVAFFGNLFRPSGVNGSAGTAVLGCGRSVGPRNATC